MKNHTFRGLLPVYLGLLVLAGCATPPVDDENFVDIVPVGNDQPLVDIQRDDRLIEEQVVPETTAQQIAPTKQVSIAGVDTGSGSVRGPDTAPDNVVQKDSGPVSSDDLWARLREDFSLGQLEGSARAVQRHERWFANNAEYFDRLSQRGYWLLPYIVEQVEQRGMPGEIALLPAIESAYRAEATSRSQAAGLWQMISATGDRFGLRQDWWMDARRDMVLSTRAALDYLEFLHDHFNGDWELAIAAYNSGEGTIRRAVATNKREGKATDFSSLSLRQETTQYVPKLIALRNVIATPEKFGISLGSVPNQQTLAIIEAGMPTDLVVAASLIPVTEDALVRLNRGYRRGVTPPGGPHHIVVPAQFADELDLRLSGLPGDARLRWTRHEVRKGEYLGRIARDHGVTVDAIVKANQLRSHLIQPGQELRIPLSIGHAVPSIVLADLETLDGDKIYTVKEGDSLWAISRVAGVSVSSLLRWNGITKNTVLYPGQRLIIGRSA